MECSAGGVASLSREYKPVHMQLVRLIKAFCPDFRPIRQILISIGATCMEQKEQSDYFFSLPVRMEAPASRRLKLRVENGQPRWIYYYDRNQDSSFLATFHRFEVRDLVIKDIVAAALGIENVVRKQREVWRTEHVIFNLDQLHGVGQIFELELDVGGPLPPGPEADYYRQLFRPYLEAEIHGSNEDLVAALPEKPEMAEILEAKTAEDFQSARHLLEEYAKSLGFDLDFQDFDAELQNLPGEYAPPHGCIFLAKLGGRIVGCVALRKWNGTICEMKRLYAIPEARGEGISRKLAEAIIRQAREMGYKRMRLDTLSSMQAANRLYSSLGFRSIEPYRYNPLEGAAFYELVL